jgi:carbonic anhydrase/acetyltransferase-like protein (isoleucine patch superfamily)
MSGLILPYRDRFPKIAEDAFIAPTATVIGDVEIGAQANLWFGVIVRGDVNRIRIGARTNVQDATMIHCTGMGGDFPTLIGDDVTIGHMVVLHGCTLEDKCMVGIKAVVMDGVVVESGGMVAAGALVTPGKRVKKGELWAGSPARKLRDLGPDEFRMIERLPGRYAELGAEYRTRMMSGGPTVELDRNA